MMHNDLQSVRWLDLDRVVFLLIAALLVLVMNMGLLSAVGISNSLVRIASEGLAVALIGLGVFGAGKTSFLEAFRWSAPLLAACFLGVVSGFWQGRTGMELALFTREIMSPVLFLTAFFCVSLDARRQARLFDLLKALLVLQLVVVALKFVLIGVNEKGWIGTMHQSAGQLGVLMPLLAMGYVWGGAVARQRVLGPALIVLMLGMFAVVSEKRVVLVTVPFVSLLVLIVWALVRRGQDSTRWFNGQSWRFVARYLLVTLFITLAVTQSSLSLIPSLDADSTKYKAYDTQGVSEYAVEYLTRDYDSKMNASSTGVDENPNIQLGRLRLLHEAIFQMLDVPIVETLFGRGGGWLLEHRLLATKGEDVTYRYTGLRGPSGIGFRYLFEIGWLGTGLVLLWLSLLLLVIFRGLRQAPDKALLYGTGVGLIVLAFDFVMYSPMTWNSGVYLPVFMFLLARALHFVRILPAGAGPAGSGA